MIDPNLHYQVWKQEHGEMMRAAAQARLAREARRSRRSSGGDARAVPSRKSGLGAGVLRLRSLFAAADPAGDC